MSARLMAILEFDAGRLRELLQLPESAEIIWCRMDRDCRGRIEVVIEGAGFPTDEGGFLHRTTCTVTIAQTEDGGIELNPKLEWGFPDLYGGAE